MNMEIQLLVIEFARFISFSYFFSSPCRSKSMYPILMSCRCRRCRRRSVYVDMFARNMTISHIIDGRIICSGASESVCPPEPRICVREETEIHFPNGKMPRVDAELCLPLHMYVHCVVFMGS